ncbi:glycerate kinase [Ammoniphilus sp. YIM 78166]|uniref:glycerate kinase n=1 Tax=Ammoniphilus sp. YIM 78166 TaxID=1644106 RepID=UPI00106F577F|nr:glycerate kinase [Ammoniphilus sp. YIM 78166]
MKILIAPDSYKGSLCALEVAQTMRKAFSSVIKEAEVDLIPMADGGEGTLDTLVYATKGKVISVTATGPLGEQISTEYGVLGDKETVIVEAAKIVGLPMIPQEKRDPLIATTYGIGEVILDALNRGYRKFIFGLGGSATNEGGIGLLQALGVKFLNEEGRLIKPMANNLLHLKSVDFGTIDPRIRECSMVIASDVDNALCGSQGASCIYGPQKGATPQQVEWLDGALSYYAGLIEEHLKVSHQHAPGAGAAGGLGFGLLTLGATITSGAAVVADKTDLASKLLKAQWVITGEGRSDAQTLYGKVPYYIASRAKEAGVKAILVSGGLGSDIEPLYDFFVSCHSITRSPISLQECMQNADEYLFQTCVDIARLMFASSEYKRGEGLCG